VAAKLLNTSGPTEPLDTTGGTAEPRLKNTDSFVGATGAGCSGNNRAGALSYASRDAE